MSGCYDIFNYMISNPFFHENKGNFLGVGVTDKEQNDKKMKAVKRFTLFSGMDLARVQAAAFRHRKSYVAE